MHPEPEAADSNYYNVILNVSDSTVLYTSPPLCTFFFNSRVEVLQIPVRGPATVFRGWDGGDPKEEEISRLGGVGVDSERVGGGGMGGESEGSGGSVWGRDIGGVWPEHVHDARLGAPGRWGQGRVREGEEDVGRGRRGVRRVQAHGV